MTLIVISIFLQRPKNVEKNYYSWNTQVLIDWLRQELCGFQNLRLMSAELNIPSHELQAWFTSPMPTINLKQIQEIAKYREWDIDATMHWLGLKPAHIRSIVSQELFAHGIKLEDLEIV